MEIDLTSPNPPTTPRGQGLFAAIEEATQTTFPPTINTQDAQQLEANGLVPVVKKRAYPFSFSHSPTERLSQRHRKNQDHATAKEKIEEAHQLLIEASALYKTDRKEQERVLELLGLFRAFSDRTHLPTATQKLEKQVSTLENTVNRLAKIAQPSPPMPQDSSQTTQAPALQASSQTGATPAPRASTQTTSASAPRVSYAKALQSTQLRHEGNTHSGLPSSTQNSQTQHQWNTVSRKQQKAKSKEPCRLVLGLADKEFKVDSLFLRNRINQSFQEKGFRGLIAVSVNKSVKGNLVLIFSSEGAKDFAIKHLEVLRPLVPFSEVLEDSTWFKVVAHGISTADFGIGGPEKVKDEIETFNKGLKVVCTPLWLSNAEQRAMKQGASMLLAFATEAEATQAIRNRLWIGAQSIRVERAKDKERNKQSKTNTASQ